MRLRPIRWLLSLGACGACLAVQLLAASPVLAYSYCQYPAAGNRYAQQTTAHNQWNGVYALLQTTNPQIKSGAQPYYDFSVSHVFMEYGWPFIEVGFYVGSGYPQGSNVTSVPAYYDVWRSTQDGYQERDKQVFPALGTWNSYEIVYDSYDSTGHNYYWDVLVNGTRIEQVINNDLQKTGQAAAGGETNHPADLNGISVSAQPQELLQGPSVPWTEWTPTLMTTSGDSTTTCVDLGVTWTYTNQFDKYSAYGIVQG